MPDLLDYASYAEVYPDQAFHEELERNRAATGVHYGVLITRLPVRTRHFEMRRSSCLVGKCPRTFVAPLGDTGYRKFLELLRYHMQREMDWLDDRYETWNE